MKDRSAHRKNGRRRRSFEEAQKSEGRGWREMLRCIRVVRLSTGQIKAVDPRKIPYEILKDPIPDFLIQIMVLQNFLTTMVSRISTGVSRSSTVASPVTAEESGLHPL
ncbi:hypothetical protein SNN58_003942 [Cronobacter dublinensis]|nr:hypothetical protein [Cronobacter dublinensis]ELY3972012.1 hypothetical protein [Cronobacter dublinensis]ELY4487126.1 hypothetical protein [Cronobacter dublinensis]ELY5825354.1 hypothetical protein [Cronobacter dublinensis]